MEEVTKKVNIAHGVIDDLEKSLLEEYRKVNALRETLREVLIIVKHSRHRTVVIQRAAKALAESEPGFEDLSAYDQARLKFHYCNLPRPE